MRRSEPEAEAALTGDQRKETENRFPAPSLTLAAPDSVIVLLVVVLLITYVPGLTLWLVHLLEGRGML